eukprot:g17304.t2
MSEWKQVQAEGLAMGEGGFTSSASGNSSETFRLKPVGNMFEWHFTFLGAKGTPFEGGLYHGSISLPENYPKSGPSVRMLNPNQRFKVGSRICLSASEFHQDSWQPSWTVTSLVTALVAHMTEPAVEIGSVRGATKTQKRRVAARSRSFECPLCGCRHSSFPEDRFPTPEGFDQDKGRNAPRPRDGHEGGAGSRVGVKGGVGGGGRTGGPIGGGEKGVAAGTGADLFADAIVESGLPQQADTLHQARIGSSESSDGAGGGRSSRGRLPGIRPRQQPPPSKLAMDAGGAGEGEADKEEEVGVDGEKKDAGVLAATGACGALVGWNLAHSLGMGLDLVGALGGCLVAVGLLAQEGLVGEATTKVGEFALGAFDVVSVVAETSEVPAKIAKNVGEEILEVVEFTSAAATKGYMESLPEPNLKLEKEVAQSKKKVVDLKGQVEEVKQALAEAKAQLKERAENQKVVNAAKATAAELAAAKQVIKEKDDLIAKNLKLARKVKDAFDVDLKAAKAETARFRDMLQSRADVDDNFKFLAEASNTLEERVQEYEARLRVLTEENDAVRADYSAEIKSMEAERASMRERISSLETALASSETAIDQQRASLEAELSKMGQALEEKSAAAQSAATLAAEMKAAVQQSLKEKGEALERAAAEAKAAGAAKSAAEQEKARAAEEVKAAKAEAAKAAAAARAEGAAKAKAEKKAAAAAAAAAAKKEKAKETEKREADKKKAADEEAKQRRRQKEQEAMAEKEKTRATAAQKSRSRAASPAAAKASPVAAKASPVAAKASPVAAKASPVATKAVATKAAVAPAPAEPAGAPAVSKERLMKSTVKDLRERCKAAGVPTSGKKSDLVDRLVEASLSVA